MVYISTTPAGRIVVSRRPRPRRNVWRQTHPSAPNEVCSPEPTPAGPGSPRLPAQVFAPLLASAAWSIAIIANWCADDRGTSVSRSPLGTLYTPPLDTETDAVTSAKRSMAELPSPRYKIAQSTARSGATSPAPSASVSDRFRRRVCGRLRAGPDGDTRRVPESVSGRRSRGRGVSDRCGDHHSPTPNTIADSRCLKSVVSWVTAEL